MKFKEYMSSGHGPEIQIWSKRICFTDIPKRELRKHSKIFGPITLEWKLEKLVDANACPVFYLPGDLYNRGITNTFLARCQEIQAVLQDLDSIKTMANTNQPNLPFIFQRNGTINSSLTMQAASQLFQHLEYQRQPISQLLNSFKVISHLFYPTDNSKYTSKLDYYNQREWRIFSGIRVAGQSLTQDLTLAEAANLESIDSDFFGKEIQFISGKDKRVNKCEILRKIGTTDVAKTINKIYAPYKMHSEITSLLKAQKLSIEVRCYPIAL